MYAAPDRIVVCSGTVQAVMLLSRVLQTMGATKVAVESPGFHVLRNVITASGLSIQHVGVDDHGAKIEELAGGHADAALLTPAHQFPMGASLAPQQRTAAIEWARATGGFLIEDDYDGEFRYDRQPTGALQGLDPEHVVYIGTASKSLAPGLRLAWMVLPHRLIEPVALAKSVTDWQTSSFEQLALAGFIESGAYDRHVRRSRLRYHKRRNRLTTTLATRAPQGEAEVLIHLGDTHLAAGNVAVAQAALQHALDALTELGHPSATKVVIRLRRLPAAATQSY